MKKHVVHLKVPFGTTERKVSHISFSVVLSGLVLNRMILEPGTGVPGYHNVVPDGTNFIRTNDFLFPK
jgi:hypothetical protein